MYSRAPSMFRGWWRFESRLNLPLMEYPRDLATLGLVWPMWNINGTATVPLEPHCCQSRMWHAVALTITLDPLENNPTCFMWVAYKRIWCWPYQNVKVSTIWHIFGSSVLCKVHFEKLSSTLFDTEKNLECCSSSRAFHCKHNAKETKRIATQS